MKFFECREKKKKKKKIVKGRVSEVMKSRKNRKEERNIAKRNYMKEERQTKTEKKRQV